MRLALVRLRYTGFGGAELYVSRLARRLIDRGHEVHVLAREWEAPETPGLVFHQVHSAGGPTFVRQPSFARAVARMVGELKFDLVHSFDRTYSQDVYRAGDGCHLEFLARRARAEGRRRAFFDRLNPKHRALLRLEARLFADPRLKVVLANSERGREEIIRHYGLPGTMVRVLYNGVDRARFHPGLSSRHRDGLRRELGLSPGDPVTLFVGSGFRRKGLKELIEAVALTRAVLLVAGGDRKEPYERLARRRGAAGRVLFLGPRPDVDRLYGAADLFVLPSWYEPFSNACLEALAAGLPVVTTAESGAAEAVEEGRNGFTVRFPVRPEELVDKMEAALSLARAAVIAANTRILEPFDWDLNVERTLAVYEEFLAR
ncbi:MAG: glycosyltransferase family 4 protein [Thermodesulfobacteriota bacterium]